MKRRAISRSSTLLPAQGKSETVSESSYGHAAMLADKVGRARSSTVAHAETTNTPSTLAVRSTINAAGIRDEKCNLSAIMLIPLRKQHHLASEIHRM